MATLRGKTEKKIAPAAPKVFPCREGNSHIFLLVGEKNSTFSKNILPCAPLELNGRWNVEKSLFFPYQPGL